MTGQFTRFDRGDATYEFRTNSDDGMQMELVIRRAQINASTISDPLYLDADEMRDLRDHLIRATNYENERDATTRRIKELNT